MIAFLAVTLPLTLYLAFPSGAWNFDGVACAAALELGDSYFYFHGNHLLYGFFGFGIWRLVLNPMGIHRALPALQLFTSLLSAAGLYPLFQVVRQQLSDDFSALWVVLAVSVTAVFWVWSLEAQVYALGFLGIAWATYFLFQPPSSEKWVWVGGSHALAILGHVLHGVWIIPCLYWLWQENAADPQARQGYLFRYLLTLMGGVLSLYLLVIAVVILPHQPQTQSLWHWLLGSAALTPDRHFAWHWAGRRAPFLWASTSLRVLWGSFWPYARSTSRTLWLLTGASALGWGGVLLCSGRESKTLPWRFSFLWILAYGLFLWTWEPRTECYRMSEIIPLAIALSLGAQQIRRRVIQKLVLSGIFVSTLLVNFYTRISPMHQTEKNALFMEVSELAAQTPENSIYLTLGGSPWIYLLYFTGRQAFDLHRAAREPDAFWKDLARQRGQRPVLISTAALEDERVKPWLSSFKCYPLAKGLPWQQLQ